MKKYKQRIRLSHVIPFKFAMDFQFITLKNRGPNCFDVTYNCRLMDLFIYISLYVFNLPSVH